MLTWPQKSLSALSYLFRPLQDLDIYVEDSNDEVFYTELFKRISPEGIRIARVYPVGSRTKVIEAAKEHDFSERSALFIIDGDFEWVRDEQPAEVLGLHRLPAYCIENLIIQEQAIAQIISEEIAVHADVAKATYGFDDWLESVVKNLLDLFVWFATLNHTDPARPTTSLGVGSVIVTAPPDNTPALCPLKIGKLAAEVVEQVTSKVGQEAATRSYSIIAKRVRNLAIRSDIISGKDYLLPLCEFRLWPIVGRGIRRKSLRVRLARHTDPARFSQTRAAISSAARGHI